MLKDLYTETRNHMQKALDALEHHLSGLRTGRANPAILKSIRVDYYGSLMPIEQLGTITAPDARTLVIQSWDAGALKSIEKAIRDSDLGLNPNNKGDSLFISIPPPHRRTPPRVGEGSQALRRGSPGSRAQRPAGSGG